MIASAEDFFNQFISCNLFPYIEAAKHKKCCYDLLTYSKQFMNEVTKDTSNLCNETGFAVCLRGFRIKSTVNCQSILRSSSSDLLS